METIDISYNCKEPINDLLLETRLSNLYPYKFEMDGVKFNSWEGFIQSLKTPDIEIKKTLWDKHGYWAWKNGQNINWWEKQTVYWIDKPIDRHSDEYLELITRSYDELFKQNEKFRIALEESIPFKLDHSKGKTSKNKTLLTKAEYLFQMYRLRKPFIEKTYHNLDFIF